LETVTAAEDPAVASSVFGTCTVIWVGLTLAGVRVVCVVAFHCTVDPAEELDAAKKFVPVIVNKNVPAHGAAHAGRLFGLSSEIVGTGLGGGLITKATVFERPLFPATENGLCVMTVAVPVLATKDAGTTAVSHSTFGGVLVSSCGVVTSFVPFQVTYVCTTNPLPFTVNVNCGLPALTVDGETEVIEAPVLFWNVFP
jgi:hypothetical protein